MRYEAETMRYIAAHTTIPVPHVYRCGTAAENPTGLGPFIIMDWIDSHQNMSRSIKDQTRPLQDAPVLDPAVDKAKLEKVYRQMANILLQLHHLEFPRIGSLSGNAGNLTPLPGDDTMDSTVKRLNKMHLAAKRDKITVSGRPLIQSMSDLIVHNNCPNTPTGTILPPPSRTYTSARAWFAALADMHLATLILQRNDCLKDADDARDMYISRQLLRNLARDNKLVTAPDDDFGLFSEDFRPANVLVDENDNIVGVIDWEFAYVAPAQFSYDPPWWLLIMKPQDWEEVKDGGCRYKEWMRVYEPKLEIFLRVLREEEFNVRGGAANGRPLSQRMKESWDSGAWILNYAIRDFWAFDYLWWMFLDERFFGPNEDKDHKARLDLLTDAQREVMEEFVERKMREKEEGGIGHWSEEEAAAVLKKFMV